MNPLIVKSLDVCDALLLLSGNFLFFFLWISTASCSFGLEFCLYSLFLKLIHFKLAAYRVSTCV